MKKYLIFIIMLAMNVVFGHEQIVHRHIVSEAWKLLTHEKPELSNTIMDAWIGSFENTTYLTSVIAGAHNEEQQDIIWMNCGFNLNTFGIEWVPCVETTINHFWNADNGDNDPVTILGSDPNALEKAKHMWYGTHVFHVGVSFANYGVEDKVDHNSLPILHNTGNVKWVGYWNSIGQYFSKNINKQYSIEYRRRIAYSTLGRICHLLADMSIPAHTHNDAHSPVSEEGTDGFEQWSKNNYSAYTWSDALDQGGTLFDVTEKNYPIRYLMYVVNQYADFFPSDGDWSGKYLGDKTYSTTYSKDGKTDYYPILNNIFSQLGYPPTSINYSLQASHLIPFAIRATAALLYLFAVESGQYTPQQPPQPLTVSISGPSYLNGGQTGTWTANASGGKTPYHYSWYYFPLCDDGGIDEPYYPDAPICGYWYSFGSDNKTVSRSDFRSFKLKVDVTDANNSLKTAYKTVNVSSNSPQLAKTNTESLATILPTETKIFDNYPNPFNPTTIISYQLKDPSFVSLKVFNVLGKEVAVLVNENKNAGYYNVSFDASSVGGGLPSGVYIYKLTVNDFVDVKKMLLTK